MQAEREKNQFAEDRERLSRQLIRLGDMIGDGLHLEPDGKWISKEYRRVAKALGYELGKRPRRNNGDAINQRMAERVNEVRCQKCGGSLKQTRSGSLQAKCESCGAQCQLLKSVRRKATGG
ncbi:hypothetical protein GKQ23_13745 [Erwinia sp. E602]|uniref:hypothetical protein n=1 Tax=Erwinia sp. E602 TaxID=2675378 RepID=UPI001BA7FE6C|nr:hypothetical protein [Erwinia sp. E602]QUG77929.1 hypothetical protein GKQ23_13745 [Erwinia sp. E602]